ncbi:MAG: class I SAM-dependent RNA methyltransferase [Blautia sp.]|nr:class I SAM-dependent RNA methyltransferase [Lachnoclostridium sp.]MCM1212799.1 class I SAM-dependent RNA methyltransferase [Blautia sp.]
MKKGQIIEGIVREVDFPCKGIVETEDGICIVKNVLPGQKVRCSVNKVRKGKAEGRLLEVLEASPLEQESPCPHFGLCGGCVYLSLPYEEQLKIKETQVKKLLDSVLKKQDGYRFEGIKPSPYWSGYRNKMEFSFGDEVKDGPLSLGMHKRGSFYDIVSVDGCQIVDEDYRRILKCVRNYFTMLQEQGYDISFYHRLRHTGYLRHLLVRKAAKTGEILIALVTTTQKPAGKTAPEEDSLSRTRTEEHAAAQIDNLEAQILEGLKEALLRLPLEGTIAGILHTKNDALADVVRSDATDILYGQDYFYEELLGLKFRISQFSFFQTNSLGAEVLYQTAREYLLDAVAALGKKDNVVFDLYSGTGTIAQLMASVARKVIGVEIVEEAVDAARSNAALNGLHNCEFLAGDVLKVIDDIEEKPDIIILDPPRDGIHPKALPKIIQYGAEHILYISCKPTSLARDLEVLLARGYRVERAVAVDMFPGTGNVETVVLLSKGEIDSKKVRVEFSLEDMDMSGFWKGATYQEIKDYVKEQTGLSVSSLYISQIKRKCGLDVGQNYNLSKKENAKMPQCPLGKEEAIRAAFKHFGIL